MKILFTCLTLLFCFSGYAQGDHKHDTHQSPDDDKDDEEKDMDKDDDGDHMDYMDFHHTKHPMIRMSHAYSLYLPMTRNGSGTSWLPDASYMFGHMIHAGNWVFMAGGDIFLRYNKQDLFDAGTRGAEKADAPDMLMFMGQRKVGSYGLFHFNTMFSTDMAIAGGSGYPLLFQTGESWQNKPLVDRQHPHDLFSELSVSYAHALSSRSDLYLYLAYPGEPALGPVTFMHRTSGMFNPDAPLGHHWADATHITFGVATLGFRYGKAKLEGSLFNGREPDESRYDFDHLRLDSRSARLSFNPSYNWSLQVSQGFLKSPEGLHPDEDITRTTASATYVHTLGKFRYFSGTVLWGNNIIKGSSFSTNSILAEATIKSGKTIGYARYEWVQKTAEDLNLPSIVYDPLHKFNISEATLGGSYELFNVVHITVAAGAQLTAYFTPSQLTYTYGDLPIGGEVYLHLYPMMMNTRK